ncbi:MAG TPA: hypothetical protein DCM60_04990 [Nitrospina sp.]|nr:hypothetical protein [Nitrospina sp.]
MRFLINLPQPLLRKEGDYFTPPLTKGRLDGVLLCKSNDLFTLATGKYFQALFLVKVYPGHVLRAGRVLYGPDSIARFLRA